MSAEKFFNHTELLRCPACGTAFSRCGSSLRCEKGHTYDPSKKGWINLAPNTAPSRYGSALFEARRRILEGGFYDAVLHAIRSAMPENPETVLDAGCGDGTFTKALQGNTTIGLDLSKDAIRLAAFGGGPILWVVGDLTRLPLKNTSVDVILNLFSPAHYAEFARVLKPDGKLLKLVPQEGYLREIRALMADRLHREAYSNDAVVSHLSEQFHIADRIRIFGYYPLTEEQARDFLFMTPLTFGTDPGALDASLLKQITIDVELLIAERPGK